MTIRAVIFDLGGVVVDSPLHAIRDFEATHGIAPGAVNRIVVTSGSDGAWARLERGELSVAAFCPAFEADCARGGLTLDARALMAAVAGAGAPRPVMLGAVARLRAAGMAVAALTNNWVVEGGETGMGGLREHFDVFVESAVEGLRKPDPRIYRLVCERLGVAPSAAVFLDDIGLNLKAARALGMHTIKVTEVEPALEELEAIVGVALR